MLGAASRFEHPEEVLHTPAPQVVSDDVDGGLDALDPHAGKQEPLDQLLAFGRDGLAHMDRPERDRREPFDGVRQSELAVVDLGLRHAGTTEPPRESRRLQLLSPRVGCTAKTLHKWVRRAECHPAAALQAADTRPTSGASAAAHAITVPASSSRSCESAPTSRSCASRMRASTGRDAPLFPEQ